MSITSLNIHQFRNIDSSSITLSPHCNIISGDNGSGKTSIIEAIHMLGLARSFRSHLSRRIIQYGKDSFAISGLLANNYRVGIEKTCSGVNKIRINGTNMDSSAELAELLPFQLINPDSYELLDSGPQYRRQFLDWGVFHVEQPYLEQWRQYQRCLKQRNAALKAQCSYEQIQLWDQLLITSAERIDEMRAAYIERFIPVFKAIFSDLLDFDIVIHYKRGWDADLSLVDVMAQNHERDRYSGYTHNGAHRADIKITVNKIPAVDVLSRGQQKLLVCALRLAQGMLLKDDADKPCLFLIDDLAAELDQHSFRKISQALAVMQAQVLVTGVDVDALLPLEDFMTCKMFHVEHGNISELGKRSSQ